MIMISQLLDLGDVASQLLFMMRLCRCIVNSFANLLMLCYLMRMSSNYKHRLAISPSLTSKQQKMKIEKLEWHQESERKKSVQKIKELRGLGEIFYNEIRRL